jgi:YbbR domain-containing protein
MMKKLLLANLPEKLAAVIISLLMWQVVLRIEQPVTSRQFENIPVSYLQPKGNLFVTQKRTSIHVDAQALLSGGEAIERDAIIATVDLTDAKAGRHVFPVQMTYTGSTTTRVELIPRPRQIEVVIEEWVERTLEVTATTTGAWDLYRPGSITVTPTTVRVSGPESQIALAMQARVEINLSTVEPGSSSQAPVQILTETGAPLELTVDPSTVSVRVKPVALPPSKNVIVEPNWAGTPPFGYRIAGYEILPNQIRVMGDAETLERLASIYTSPIDISGLKESRTITVSLALPSGVRSDTARVEVRIRVEPSG